MLIERKLRALVASGFDRTESGTLGELGSMIQDFLNQTEWTGSELLSSWISKHHIPREMTYQLLSCLGAIDDPSTAVMRRRILLDALSNDDFMVRAGGCIGLRNMGDSEHSVRVLSSEKRRLNPDFQ